MPIISVGMTEIPALDELPPRALARKTIDYMGGTHMVINRAREDYERGDYRWVVHILNSSIVG